MDTMPVWLPVALPLIGALLIGLAGRWPNLREAVTLLTSAALFALVLRLVPAVLAGGRPDVVLLQMMPGLSIRFTLEPLGMLFACVASFLWIVTSVYSIGYMRGHHEGHQTRFYVCFAIALASAIGVAFAGNLLTLFIFYEMLTFSTYPLVTHAETEEAKRGGRVYLGILVFTSIVFQMPAIIWTWSLAGTLDFTPGGILAGTAPPELLSGLLVLYIFGIGKAALMPLHRWLPAAMVAPTPVSALLHAVAVVKAGVFTVLKVTFFVFGLELTGSLEASEALMYVAAATILIASLVAIREDNLKRRLAYSTVSQLSYIVLGAMTANAWGMIGGGMHIAMHAFGKITLFFCAGAILVATDKTEVSQMRGLGRTMPLTMLAFLIGSLSIIGLPPLGGLWGKWYLTLGALEAHQLVMVAVLMASSLLSLAYLLPIPLAGFLGTPPEPAESGGSQPHRGPGQSPGRVIREAPAACVIAQSLTAVGCLVLFFYPDPIYALLRSLVGAGP